MYKRQVYIIGTCTHSGNRRLKQIQTTAGCGEWRITHTTEAPENTLVACKLAIHERLKSYGGSRASSHDRETLGLASESDDCFIFDAAGYERALEVAGECCAVMSEASESDAISTEM